MNRKTNLAIIIPAYKSAYLTRTLESLASQSNKNFHVFVGDDASSAQIEEIVLKFSHYIPITYHRFDQNIGRKDLTAQWQRCIELANGYDWIWLFSDDDIFSPDAVASVHKELLKKQKYDIYRLRVDVIDSNETVLHKNPPPQSVCSGTDFLLQKWQGKRSSFAVEYIFRASHFKQIGGFSKYDLAWNSDDATWFRMSQPHGIAGISLGSVQWRSSGINISRDESISTAMRKIKADIAFMSEIIPQLPAIHSFEGIRCRISMLTWFLTSLKCKILIHPEIDPKLYIKQVSSLAGSPFLYPLARLYFSKKNV